MCDEARKRETDKRPLSDTGGVCTGVGRLQGQGGALRTRSSVDARSQGERNRELGPVRQDMRAGGYP